MFVIPDCRAAASPESIITGQRLWLPGSALTRGAGMTNGRSALVRHSGLPRSGKSGIHNHRSAAMDFGLRADARPRNDEQIPPRHPAVRPALTGHLPYSPHNERGCVSDVRYRASARAERKLPGPKPSCPALD